MPEMQNEGKSRKPHTYVCTIHPKGEKKRHKEKRTKRKECRQKKKNERDRWQKRKWKIVDRLSFFFLKRENKDINKERKQI